jgi:Putative transposase of IS4/5 family (DUF4096)
MKTAKKPSVRKDFLIPDALWEEIKPLLPKHVTHHPLGCHRKRVDDRRAMNAIFFVLKTGCQWNALNLTGPLLLELGPPPIPGVERGRSVQEALEAVPGTIRRVERY